MQSSLRGAVATLLELHHQPLCFVLVFGRGGRPSREMGVNADKIAHSYHVSSPPPFVAALWLVHLRLACQIMLFLFFALVFLVFLALSALNLFIGSMEVLPLPCSTSRLIFVFGFD